MWKDLLRSCVLHLARDGRISCNSKFPNTRSDTRRSSWNRETMLSLNTGYLLILLAVTVTNVASRARPMEENNIKLATERKVSVNNALNRNALNRSWHLKFLSSYCAYCAASLLLCTHHGARCIFLPFSLIRMCIRKREIYPSTFHQSPLTFQNGFTTVWTKIVENPPDSLEVALGWVHTLHEDTCWYESNVSHFIFDYASYEIFIIPEVALSYNVRWVVIRHLKYIG